MNPLEIVESQYNVRDGIIISRGKFEGESSWAPFFWLLEDSDEICFPLDENSSEGEIRLFYLERDRDAEFFSGLLGIEAIALWEDAQGFVHSRAFPQRSKITSWLVQLGYLEEQ